MYLFLFKKKLLIKWMKMKALIIFIVVVILIIKKNYFPEISYFNLDVYITFSIRKGTWNLKKNFNSSLRKILSIKTYIFFLLFFYTLFFFLLTCFEIKNKQNCIVLIKINLYSLNALLSNNSFLIKIDLKASKLNFKKLKYNFDIT